MAIDERSRHRLHARLEEVLGPEEAAVLMEHMPPVGWADVATKRDLDLKLEATKQEILATLRGEMAAQTRTMVLANAGLALTIAGLAFGAARLV